MQHRVHPLDRFAIDPATSGRLVSAWFCVVHATSRGVSATSVHIHRRLRACSAVGIECNKIIARSTEAHTMDRVFHECAHTTFEIIVVRNYCGVFHSASCIYCWFDIYADHENIREHERSFHRAGTAAYVYRAPTM